MASTGTAHAVIVDGGGSVGGDGTTTVGVVVSEPGSGAPGSPGDSARPLVHYLVTWSTNPVESTPGSLEGVCAAAGSTPAAPVFGFTYRVVGTDAAGAIVDDHLLCVAFPNGDTTQRPPEPPLPAVPTFGEAWASAQLPSPAVTLDPAARGITGLDTRIATAGPTAVVIAATIRGYTITGTATLDHYEISVDGQAATNSDSGHYTFETKGNHTIAISAIWHGAVAITGPDIPTTLAAVDIGSATITSTRAYRLRTATRRYGVGPWPLTEPGSFT
jgi:hypothetical protein